MPIYKGLSQVNPSQIVFNAKQMQRVYVGDKLVWQKNSIPPVHYGLLYNGFAASDARNIAAAGWHVARGMNSTPALQDWLVMVKYLDPQGLYSNNVAGNYTKETGTNGWQSEYPGTTNSAHLNLKGGGKRAGSGAFSGLNLEGVFFARSTVVDGNTNRVIAFATANTPILHAPSYGVGWAYQETKGGASIRLVKDSTTLTNGQTGTYVGNNGRLYRTICIGGQEWLADNLCETRYRNGDLIPEVTGNTEWAALTTGALCAYNNDWGNV